MTTIEIDFEVYKKLTAERDNEEVTYNDVIRDLLRLHPINDNAKVPSQNGKVDWIVKGIRFPDGTPFRMHFKGLRHSAIVNDGALELDGKRFNSPSAAAYHITNNGVNGWNYWECKLSENSSWVLISSLRIKK